MAEAPRSMEIGSHLQRMSCYSALIAERLGYDADLIRIASRLHDVGMAAVSHAVTGKAADHGEPLTTDLVLDGTPDLADAIACPGDAE